MPPPPPPPPPPPGLGLVNAVQKKNVQHVNLAYAMAHTQQLMNKYNALLDTCGSMKGKWAKVQVGAPVVQGRGFKLKVESGAEIKDIKSYIALTGISLGNLRKIAQRYNISYTSDMKKAPLAMSILAELQELHDNSYDIENQVNSLKNEFSNAQNSTSAPFQQPSYGKPKPTGQASLFTLRKPTQSFKAPGRDPLSQPMRGLSLTAKPRQPVVSPQATRKAVEKYWMDQGWSMEGNTFIDLDENQYTYQQAKNLKGIYQSEA